MKRPDTVGDLYGDLQLVYGLVPDHRKAYQALNRVFLKCLELKTDFEGVRFGGPFAKTDYLLKEHHAPRYLQRSTNDARVRMRELWKLKDSELKENFAYDFKAVCQFVSLVFHAPVPGVLEARFPQNRAERRGELKAESLRVVVNAWDERYIYANADGEGLDEVKVFYGGKSPLAVYKDWDWGYLKSLMKEDCQLNIVRPRVHEDVLYPELLIWEPDYLVDISAIAACFENYAVSPINHLLNKLKPAPNSSATVLGNLASQFLDEELYMYPGDRPYSESVQEFFRRNALSLLTAELEDDFHAQAQSQKRIIDDTLHVKLPAMLKSDDIRFDSSEIIVEPSFFSEMLGIQGRMDFLGLKHQVLIEQKSGKGGFPARDPQTPVYQQKHYVQLLLYMLLIRYNYRSSYEQNNRALHAFLLYSKYQNGLLPLGFAPDLMFTAVRMRNEIAANEYGYAQSGLTVLKTLTASGLNLNGTKGVLWERYQKPQIEQLLTPVHTASELERAYYLRFLTFIETEHLMAKVGNQTKENAGFSDKWQCSLEDKLQTGDIYYNLTMLSPSATETGKVERVVLRFKESPDHEISNFRAGDIVILYPYTQGEEPDARRTMVFRCTIERITGNSIILHLRSAQANACVFWFQGERPWAIEHDFFESSFSTLYRGMHTFLSAPQERRDLLLLQRRPRTDKSLRLVGDYGAFNDLSLKAKQAKDLFLIIGPPGTGKTSYGLLNTLQEELCSSPETSVLLLSYTNRAVDEICGKLVENGIDFIRIGGRFSCEEAYRSYLLEQRVEQCAKIDLLRAVITRTRVFVGTTTAFNSHANIFCLKQFSLAIVDEASQILEPHLIGLLSATSPDGTCAIKKTILIGDHKQLPAVVQQNEEVSRVDDLSLRAIHLTNCRLSLFERLLKQYRDQPDVVYMLTKQGRMHHDIAQFPNREFYQGKLQEVPCPHQRTVLPASGSGLNGIDDMLTTRRIAFVAVAPPKQSISDKVNQNEAQAIAATLARIYELNRSQFSPLHTVGVIVPYRNQISEVRNCIGQYGIPALRDVTIDTVERYQGSQRDYIVYGFTIQKPYQLSFLASHVFEEDGCLIDRKLNVAMTRAREHLVMLGNPQLLAENTTFQRLMTYTKERHCYFEVALSDYVNGHFAVSPSAV